MTTPTLAALLAAATPRPWFVEYAGDFGKKTAIVPDVLRERYGRNALDFGGDHATAEMVVALVNAADTWVSERAELEERVRAAEAREATLPKRLSGPLAAAVCDLVGEPRLIVEGEMLALITRSLLAEGVEGQ